MHDILISNETFCPSEVFQSVSQWYVGSLMLGSTYGSLNLCTGVLLNWDVWENFFVLRHRKL